ncbi:MAG TPA: hypothetical protein VMV82_03560 [Candidatus Dormibacteraeota bacterium]|nr:hypothetical protein [Candidatus Dormibacteraeota bacterium]
MTQCAVAYGPRLIVAPTATMRSALVVRPTLAIERGKPLNGEPGAILARAVEQHAVLVRTLRYFDVDVRVLDASGDDSHACAVADAAMLFENGALLMRPSSMSRRAEIDHIAAELCAIDIPLAGRIAPPGLLDGTDVLLIENTAFVGAGTRGNAIGRNGFATVARASGFNVVEVPLAAGVASLQSVVGVAGPQTIVLAPGCVDAAAFSDFRTIELERGEELGAGVLCLGQNHVIADVRYRTALQRMRRAGITVEGIDLYEFEKIGITPSMLVLPLRRE